MPSYRQAVEDYQAKKPEMIMVILPNVNVSNYHAFRSLKLWGENSTFRVKDLKDLLFVSN